jgi:hypothetical protein
VVSSQPIDVVMARIAAAVGHPDMKALSAGIHDARTYLELETLIHSNVGPADLMEMGRFDIGAVLGKAAGPNAPRSWRLLIGNPLIMKAMTEHVPDAASYAPVTLLIDERPDGVHLSYDRMVSFLRPYRNPEALKIAASLDAKVEGLLRSAASSEAPPKSR